MLIKQKLDEAISKWAILNSRFYKAWQSGELPKSALFQYAVEYGNFIRLLPKGWDTLNDAETAEEEKEHVFPFQHCHCFAEVYLHVLYKLPERWRQIVFIANYRFGSDVCF